MTHDYDPATLRCTCGELFAYRDEHLQHQIEATQPARGEAMNEKPETAHLSITIPSDGNPDERFNEMRDDLNDLIEALGSAGVKLGITGIRVHCDTCHTGGPLADSFAEALGAAVLAGWAHRTNGTDECPNCIATQPEED